MSQATINESGPHMNYGTQVSHVVSFTETALGGKHTAVTVSMHSTNGSDVK